MRLSLVVLNLLVVWTVAERDPKFLSMFNIVRFKNNKCENDSGLCYTKEECANFGGRSTASCASSFGTCCQIYKSCGDKANHKMVYFTNPNGVGTTDMSTLNSCQFTVEVSDPSKTQLRLDFVEFELDQPTNGVCRDDELTFLSTGNLGISSICGHNSGQHLYLHAVSSSNVLTIRTSGDSPYKWNIKITQVTTEHDPDWWAPSGCAQYFTDSNGMIQSFNFNGGNGHYFRNLDYSICIKRATNTCRVRFTSTDRDFTIRGKHFLYKAAKTDNFCSNNRLGDYLVFPEVSDDARKYRSVFRICSDRLSYKNLGKSDYVTHYGTGPIVLRFHTDNKYDKKKERGFKITYQQSASNCDYSKYSSDDKYEDKDKN